MPKNKLEKQEEQAHALIKKGLKQDEKLDKKQAKLIKKKSK